MVAPIVIDLGIADPPQESVQVLANACSQAATDTTCYLVRQAPEGPYAAIAIVTWEADDRVRIEVGLRRAEGAEWRSRDIAFQVADAEIERYRSVGFVIGTLASADKSELARRREVPRAAPASVGPPPTERRRPPAKTAPPPESAQPARGFIVVAAAGSRATSEGAPRLGGQLRAGVLVYPRLLLLLSTGASARARDDQGLVLSWLDAGGGLGWSLGPGSGLRLELRLEAVVERLAAEARTPRGVNTRSRTQLAARLGADGVVPLGGFVSLVLGVEALGRGSKTYFSVEGAPAGATELVQLGGALGVRLDL